MYDVRVLAACVLHWDSDAATLPGGALRNSRRLLLSLCRHQQHIFYYWSLPRPGFLLQSSEIRLRVIRSQVWDTICKKWAWEVEELPDAIVSSQVKLSRVTPARTLLALWHHLDTDSTVPSSSELAFSESLFNTIWSQICYIEDTYPTTPI